MAVITALMLALGTLLAAAGTLGFLINATTAPDPDSFRITRRTATAGRWLAGIGLSRICAEPTRPSGIVLGALLAIAALAVATLITKAPLKPTGARGA